MYSSPEVPGQLSRYPAASQRAGNKSIAASNGEFFSKIKGWLAFEILTRIKNSNRSGGRGRPWSGFGPNVVRRSKEGFALA
jgi:hypothetical protein